MEPIDNVYSQWFDQVYERNFLCGEIRPLEDRSSSRKRSSNDYGSTRSLKRTRFLSPRESTFEIDPLKELHTFNFAPEPQNMNTKTFIHRALAEVSDCSDNESFHDDNKPASSRHNDELAIGLQISPEPAPIEAFFPATSVVPPMPTAGLIPFPDLEEQKQPGHQRNKEQEPVQVQSEDSCCDDLNGFSISTLTQSKEPMLLTLTSFPFRIIFASDSYTKLSGKASVIGETFFDAFVSESVLKPSIATCPSLEGKFEDKIVRASSTREEQGVFCKINVTPIMKGGGESGQRQDLRYYVVKLNKVEKSETANTSVVYEPMP